MNTTRKRTKKLKRLFLNGIVIFTFALLVFANGTMYRNGKNYQTEINKVNDSVIEDNMEHRLTAGVSYTLSNYQQQTETVSPTRLSAGVSYAISNCLYEAKSDTVVCSNDVPEVSATMEESENTDSNNQEVNQEKTQDTTPQIYCEDVDEEKYISTTKLNVRDSASLDSNIIGYLTVNEKVTITGVITNQDGESWGRFTYNDSDAYVSYKYLSDIEVEVKETWSEADTYNNSWTGEVLNRSNGIVRGPIGKESYYNLRMNRVVQIMKEKGYDYDYWVRSDGVKMFGPYVMVAADLSVYPKGTLVECTLGTGMVCDTGDFVYSTDRALDIAVAW